MVIIAADGDEPDGLVPLDADQSRNETAYLLRSPANARRLAIAIERLESGGGAQHELAD